MRRLATPVLALALATTALLPVTAHAAPVLPKGNPVIVIGNEGGFVAPGVIKYALPSLVVYANGAVLVQADGPRPDVMTMQLHAVSTAKLRAVATVIAKAAITPKGGWGSPGVADVPNTYIRIAYPGLKRNVSVYALSFTTGGDVTPAQATARKALQRSIDALRSVVRSTKAKAWIPANYEAWTMAQLVKIDGVGMPNPASVFCESMGGTLSIQSSTQGQVGYCTLPDGTRTEEWAYFRALSPTLSQWPATLAAPVTACTVVQSARFLSAWKATNDTGRWLLPSGQAPTFVFRPVLPGEKACKRG